jgi:hypothetical protein
LHDPAQFPCSHASESQFPKDQIILASLSIYLPRPKLGYEDIVMHWSDMIVFKPNFLTTLRDPLDITTVHYPLERTNLVCTICMLKYSVGIIFIFLRVKVLLTFYLEFEGEGVKIGGSRFSVGTH